MATQDEIIADIWWYPLRWGDTLSNHDWVPLYVNRLLTSTFVAHSIANGRRGDIGTALILWAASFKEDPAGTLPDDDVRLAQIAGFGPDIESWREARAGALYGWREVEIEGGDLRGRRLGHEVIAEIASSMFKRKVGRDQAREAGRVASQRHRVRQKIKALGYRKPFYESDQVIGLVSSFLNESGLNVSDDNVRMAMEMAAGIPRGVESLDLRRKGGGGGE